MHCESKSHALFSVFGLLVGCLLSLSEYSVKEATAAITQPDIKRFLPKDATLGEILKIDLNNDGTDENIFTYSRVVSRDLNKSAFGFTVLSYEASKGWRAIHNETAKWGSPEGIRLGVIREPVGPRAAFIIEDFSGAGVSCAWWIVTYIDGQLKEIYSDPVTQQALKAKGYTSLGYNDPHVVIDNIVEDKMMIATNDPNQPRLYLKIRYKFTGTSIEVVDTKVMEPDNGRYDPKKKTEAELRVEAHEKTGANPELITDDEANDFILAWIDLNERPDKFDSVMGLYADEVDLYQFGRIQKSAVAEDKKTYFNKWPFRTYTLETVRLLPGVTSNEKRANVVFHYRISNSKKVVHGNVRCVLTIQKRKGKIQIISEKSG